MNKLTVVCSCNICNGIIEKHFEKKNFGELANGRMNKST